MTQHEKAIDTDWILKNVFIESFTIHARALALFLYKGPRRAGDVTAEQYVKDLTAWRTARGAIPTELQEVIDRTGKEIAHLTTWRRPAGDPRKGWSFEHVYRLFLGPLHLFLKHAEPARLDASVRAFIMALPTPQPRRRGQWCSAPRRRSTTSRAGAPTCRRREHP